MLLFIISDQRFIFYSSFCVVVKYDPTVFIGVIGLLVLLHRLQCDIITCLFNSLPKQYHIHSLYLQFYVRGMRKSNGVINDPSWSFACAKYVGRMRVDVIVSGQSSHLSKQHICYI